MTHVRPKVPPPVSNRAKAVAAMVCGPSDLPQILLMGCFTWFGTTSLDEPNWRATLVHTSGVRSRRAGREQYVQSSNSCSTRQLPRRGKIFVDTRPRKIDESCSAQSAAARLEPREGSCSNGMWSLRLTTNSLDGAVTPLLIPHPFVNQMAGHTSSH